MDDATPSCLPTLIDSTLLRFRWLDFLWFDLRSFYLRALRTVGSSGTESTELLELDSGSNCCVFYGLAAMLCNGMDLSLCLSFSRYIRQRWHQQFGIGVICGVLWQKWNV